MKSFASVILSFILISQSAFAQFTEGESTPQNQPAPARPAAPLNLPTQGQCAFEPQLSAADASLLSNARNAINILRGNNKCQAVTAQFDAFEAALKSYNQQTGADRVPGFDGNLNVTCANYTEIYDSQYSTFSDNWRNPASDINDPYYTCQGKDEREEAITCAAVVVGRQKSLKKSQCDAQKDAISAQATADLLSNSYKTGLQAVQAVLNNNDCIDAAGEQKLSFIQSAVSLASRGASLSALGTGAGLLIGAASEVVGSAIKNFFTSSIKNKDRMVVLENRDNFTKVACLYEQVEAKAIRCDRIAASKDYDALRSSVEAYKSFCDANADILSANSTIPQIQLIMNSLTPRPQSSADKREPAEAAEAKLEQSSFDALMTNLEKKMPGTEQSVLEVGLQASEEVAQFLGDVTSTDEKLIGFLKEQTEKEEFSGAELRQWKASLEDSRKSAQSVADVLKSIHGANAKGSSMSAEDLNTVEAAMKKFDGGTLNFVGAYNRVLIQRATNGDDIGEKLKVYNAKLSESLVQQEGLSHYMQLGAKSISSFEDGGRFLESRDLIRPHLERLLTKELDALRVRASLLKAIPVGAPPAALKEHLQTQEESVIYPMLRACNQLRSVTAEYKKGDTLDVSGRRNHEICAAFDCKTGNQTFENYLASNNLQSIDPKKCGALCTPHYDRYICDQKGSLKSTRDRVKTELLENGSICGQSLANAFRKR
jgi:hypothetical protein